MYLQIEKISGKCVHYICKDRTKYLEKSTVYLKIEKIVGKCIHYICKDRERKKLGKTYSVISTDRKIFGKCVQYM